MDYINNKNIYKEKNLDVQKLEQEYMKKATEAKEKLIDYYGTAMSFFGNAIGDLCGVEKMQPNELINEAKKLHIIK